MSEFFVDEQTIFIAPANTWPTLSLNQLLETKIQLTDKLYRANGKLALKKPLERALENLEFYIEEKMNSASEY